jgi:Zn-dependent protease
MDRPRVVMDSVDGRNGTSTLRSMDDYRDYRPIQPRGTDWRGILRRIWAPIAALVGLGIKFGFVFLKFFGLFVSVGAYALIWGWRFAVVFVALIFVHELGHIVAAKAQGLEVSAPMFIPFFGAYVTIKHAGLSPMRSAANALAGPLFGGIGSAACWAIASSQNSELFQALAFTGFFLNLFNLIPVGMLDGGAIARAATEAWRMPVIRFEGGVPMAALRPNRAHAVLIGTMYVGLALALVYGMWQTHVPQHRL